jgi:hypothetical protein
VVKIRQVDVTMLDKPKAARPQSRELTPKQRERLEQQRQFEKMLTRVTDRDTVFEIRLDGEDKALTVRQRLMKAAQATGQDIVVRKSDKGWLVGMATDDRRSRRGRRKASASGSTKA